jgi:hypothetical protein
MPARATIGLMALVFLAACGGTEGIPTATPTIAPSRTAVASATVPTLVSTAISTTVPILQPTITTATGTSTRVTGSASVTASVRAGTPASKNVDAAAIDAAERQWIGTSIRSYTITVQDASFWHAQTNTITVENGSVVSQSATCIDAPGGPRPCKVDPFTASDYTVSGLFAWARSSIAQPELSVRITFDPDYGFPRAIGTDIPNASDAIHSLSVREFVAVPRMPPPRP